MNQSSRQISNFLFYGSNLRVLISASADEPVYREYRSLYSRYTGRMFTVTVSLIDPLSPSHDHMKRNIHVVVARRLGLAVEQECACMQGMPPALSPLTVRSRLLI
jgi:hypothetical protein